MRSTSIYIHIPFCIQICGYCDFAVSLYRKDQKEGEKKSYLEALKKEMTSRLSGRESLEAVTLYFGGGTPSLLKAEEIEDLLNHLSQWVQWKPGTEMTLEANPHTFDLERAYAWKNLGINRISLGVQSFNPDALKKLGRIHQVEHAALAIQNLRKAAFRNISLDLIYGLPGETVDDFENSLNKAITLNPQHISLYQLAIEENTPFFRLAEKKQLDLPPEEEVIGMYELAVERLEGIGFLHYELQNFARPGFESAHNNRYWHHEEFLGFGVGAYSYWNQKRFGHGKSLTAYLQKAEAGNFSPDISEDITAEVRMKEMIILGLRLKEGINLEKLEISLGHKVPESIIKQLNRLTREEFIYKNENTYRLSLKGEHLSETVASELV